MKFELIAGKHSNRNGNFVKGDIVEANSDLEKLFRLKFRRRYDLETAGERDPVLGSTRKAAAPVSSVNKAARPAAAPVVKKGEKITNIAPAKPKAGKPDAAAQKLKKEAPQELAPKPEANAEPGDGAAEDEAKTPISDPKLGEEVTKDFPNIVSEEFAVLKDSKGRFNLVDRDTPTEAINAKPLDKEGINALISKLTD